MKTFIQTMFFFIFTISLNAQNHTVKGVVKDKNTSNEISFCSVLVLQNDSTKYFAITDDIGKFSIPVSSGKYNLVLRMLGYVADTIPFEIKSRSKSLGTLYLNTDFEVLDKVVIKESSKKNLIDRDETIVTEKLRVGAATTSDVLDKINGITFDRYNNQIKVDNESNILLLVNGIEKNQNYIKNLNPDRISKVEIIRDPSGKYGLEGYSSIINVKLKKNYTGHEYFAMVQNTLDFDPPKNDLFMPANNTYFTYNFTRKSLNIYGQYFGARTGIEIDQLVTKKYKNNISTVHKAKEGEKSFKIDETYSFLTLGADYQFNPKHTLSFEGQIGGNPKDINKGDYLVQKLENDIVLSEENFQMTTSNPSTDYSGTVFYLGKYSDKKSLNMDFTVGGNNSNSKTEFQYDDLPKSVNEIEASSTYTKFNMEWNRTLTNRFSYQLGYGNTWKSINNKLSNNPSSDLNLTDLRNRAFLYGTWKIAKPVTLKAGLAVENSLPKLGDQKQSYWIYKPHIDIQYNASKLINFKLKYRSEDEYPSLSQANPVEIALDENTIQKGNPLLTPSTIHKASLTTNILNGLVSATLFYHFSEDYIGQVGNLIENDIFEYSYDNLGGYKNKGVKFNFTIPFSKKIILQNNAKVYKSQISYKGFNNNINGWKAESQLMYIDGKSGTWAGLILQKSNSKIITPQGYRQNNNDFIGLMAQKPFLKKRLSVMFLYMLPVNLFLDYTQDTNTETPLYTQHNVVDLSILKNIFVLKVNYRFHKGKSIKSIKKNVKRETTKKKGGIF